MKRLSILFLFSMLLNLVIFTWLAFKANLFQDSFNLSRSSLGVSSRILNHHAEQNGGYTQRSRMDMIPKYKSPINAGLKAIHNGAEDAKKSIRLDDDLAIKLYYYESNYIIPQLIAESNIQEKAEKALHDYAKLCKINYQETISKLKEENLLIQKEVSLEDQNEFLELELSERLTKLNNCTKVDANIILASFHLEITVLENIYTRYMTALVPTLKPTTFRPKLVINPKNDFTTLGDSIELHIQMGALIDSYHYDFESLDVNGKEYYPDENGIVQFSEKPKRKGKNKLRLIGEMYNPLSGNIYNRSSEFEYLAIE